MIRNDQAEARTVSISVTKTSEDGDDTGRYDETPDPRSTTVWTQESEFTVGADERLTRDGFVDETGAFYLEARLATGASATRWFQFYEVAGGGIGESTIVVDIYEEGHVGISGPSE